MHSAANMPQLWKRISESSIAHAAPGFLVSKRRLRRASNGMHPFKPCAQIFGPGNSGRELAQPVLRVQTTSRWVGQILQTDIGFCMMGHQREHCSELHPRGAEIVRRNKGNEGTKLPGG